MVELKPCPFCGGDIIYAEISFEHKEFRIYCASDEGCPATMRLSFADAQLGNGEPLDFCEVENIMNEMVGHWNRRVNEC